MDFKQIDYFIEVCNTLSFSKASKNLFVSQSVISKTIKALEEELDIKLLIRNNKMVAITKNGMDFYKLFIKMRKEFNEQLELAHNRKLTEQKNLNIGVVGGYSLNKYVKYFHDECSFVDYKIEFDDINTLVKSLYNGKYDFVIGPLRGLNQAISQEGIEALTIENIKRVRRIIYFSKNHPLANKIDLKISDFKDETFYIGKSQVAKMNASEICKKEGFVGRFEPTKGRDTIYLKVYSDGYGLGDEMSRIIHDDDYKYIFIDHYQDVGLVYAKSVLSDKKYVYIKEIIDVFNKH